MGEPLLMPSLTGFPPGWRVDVIDAYSEPDNPDEWVPCPACWFRPMVWYYDNGQHASCSCSTSKYTMHTVHVEGIATFARRNGGRLDNYNDHALRDAWNAWATSGVGPPWWVLRMRRRPNEPPHRPG